MPPSSGNAVVVGTDTHLQMPNNSVQVQLWSGEEISAAVSNSDAAAPMGDSPAATLGTAYAIPAGQYKSGAGASLAASHMPCVGDMQQSAEEHT